VIEEDEGERLAAKAAGGDAEAARALVAALWPEWVRLAAASKALRAFPSSDEAALDVATRLAEKLGQAGSRALVGFPGWKERHPGKTFSDWVRIVTANACRDHARQLLGAEPTARDGAEVSRKRLLNEFSRILPEEVGFRPPVTAAQTARQLLEFAQEHLPPSQLAVLERWLQGEDFDEIARAGGLPDAAAAQRALRAGVAVLRRHFGG
jgi:DNA-directed RNA polymerase specialized sigma24 family protein